MHVNNDQLFAVLGRVYVLLRRETHRMIDVEWAVVNTDYALEVIHLARNTKNSDLLALANQIQLLHPQIKRDPSAADSVNEASPAPDKYFQTLR
ncbi:MAG: hypothetical protein PXX73_09110 [Sideroxydans sp.]|nr:hypothetical protein [Sideroxydans sp.]